MNYFKLMAKNSYDWGRLKKNEDLYLEASLISGEVYDIYFDVAGSRPIYTYFDLYDFTDDLDLHLYRYNAILDEYEKISSSTEEGNEEEEIFKGVTPGEYVLQISLYKDIGAKNSSANFEVGFDSTSYYEDAVVPNDPLFSRQWHLINTGQAGGIDNEDIFAPEAWKIRSTSPKVVVAVIDEGIELAHPDLDDNLWVNAKEIYGNGIDDDKNGYVDDIVGWNFPAKFNIPRAGNHGTHVAGIIGAEGNNGIGTTGITWDTQLMSLDVFNGAKGASDSDIIESIYYATNNGADVINMSLGFTHYFSSISEWRKHNPEVYLAYLRALTYAVDKGSTVVIAAGNEYAHLGTHLSIPAAFSSLIDGVISVAALSNTGDLAEYTNYGSTVTIAAPGGSFDKGAGILSTVRSKSYDEMPGTSMASPIVAGAAALLLGENSRFRPNDIESILTQSADRYKEMNSLVENGNFLNLKEALTLAEAYKPTKKKTKGSKKNDKLLGDKKDDILIGGSGNDTLKGNFGDDNLRGGVGNDFLHGGSGRDTAQFSSRNNRIKLNTSKWQNTRDGKDRLISIENVNAGSGNDVVTGNKAANKLNGQKGNDRLYGGGGKDLLIGGGGKDQVWGQGGRDIFRIERGTGYTIIKDFSDGADRIHLGSGRSDINFRSRGDDLFVYQRKDLLAIVEDVSAGDLHRRGSYLV